MNRAGFLPAWSAFAAILIGIASTPARAEDPADTSLSSPYAARDSVPATGSALAKDSAAQDSSLELQEKKTQTQGTRSHREKEVSRIRLTREDLKNITAAQGDPLKALGTLPGVSNQNDLSVRPNVRGGKAEETQVIWEGIPLLQPYHFGSVYSVFNIESLKDLTFYSGGFPVEDGNALSGALFMRARPAPMDTLAVSADLSLLRGNAYAGVPIIKNRLGISFSYQAFWYDWVLNRGWDAVDLIDDEKDFERAKRQFQGDIMLPNFKDLQLGLSWRFSDAWTGEYTGLISKDIFTVRDQNLRHFVNGKEVSPDFYDWDLFYRQALDVREIRTLPDTLASVSVDNGFHGLAFHWKPTSAWQFDQTFAFQSQTWGVGFFGDQKWFDSIGTDDRYYGHRINNNSDNLLDIRNRTYDWRLDAKDFATDALLLRFGASQSLRTNSFESKLPRPLFEAIVNGNTDALDALAYFDPNGFTIKRNDPGADPNVDYLNQLPRLIRFDANGNLSGLFSAAYASAEYGFDSAHRLLLGLRAETDSYADDFYLSPRIAYFQTMGKSDELSLASGLYSQDDFPFQIRTLNPALRPEKAFHFNLEWTHTFSPRYRLECQLYQKNYFDLVVPFLVNTGHLDWNSDLFKHQDSTAIQSLPKAQYDSVVERFGDRTLAYRNGGTGKAAGAEVSFNYDPNRTWGGWLTAEVGYSKRQDAPGERVYDFRYGRPWAFNWVNHFKLPNRYGLSVRGRWAAGLPYTDYVSYSTETGGDLGGGFNTEPATQTYDTLFHAGPRNGARYSPYSRWDIRLSREWALKRHFVESYFEIWNVFNTPNFLLRDSGTENWKFVDLNYPIPILFVGISGRW
ncbi:MAG: TonB-dependent receptor [Fibrobacteres bacterium]|nr:TonB-dependent receptor [Fibrobacterota bacterium]